MVGYEGHRRKWVCVYEGWTILRRWVGGGGVRETPEFMCEGTMGDGRESPVHKSISPRVALLGTVFSVGHSFMREYV